MKPRICDVRPFRRALRFFARAMDDAGFEVGNRNAEILLLEEIRANRFVFPGLGAHVLLKR